ncbi:MAG: dTDP-4-dehydrorhamnose reductase [bacterium]|nr:dTDP-4-dehydrorhamnose reductase [bacterium]
MELLITGAHGRLGAALVALLAARGHQVHAVDSDTFDVTDFPAARAYLQHARPAWVIHTAAWTDVDGCARDPQKAVLINGHGAGNIATAAAEVGAGVLYISSNEVFDGVGGRVYHEYDRAAPVNPYAYSKWVGEQAVLTSNPRAMIVRTAWLFAHGGKNFIQSILNAASAGNPLRVVTNEIGNPTYNDDAAAAVAALVEIGRCGVYHLVNEGHCSRYAFARYALDQAGYGGVAIQPISAAEWPRASVPPEYTPLANTAGAMLGIRLRTWQAAVDAFLAKEGVLKA